MGINNRNVTILLKIYIVIILAIAVALSPLELSFIPVLILIGYLYLWFWISNPRLNLFSELLVFLAIPLMMSTRLTPYLSPLLSLPVLLLIDYRLTTLAAATTLYDTGHRRYPTNTSVTMAVVLVAILIMGGIFENIALLLAVGILIIYFGYLALIISRMPSLPVDTAAVPLRVLAETEARIEMTLKISTRAGGQLLMRSPYDWLKVNPSRMALKEGTLKGTLSLTPRLSGPNVIKLQCYATDRWGLMQVNFEIQPLTLYVIPRARYAVWLAQRYLQQTGQGVLPLVSSISALKPMYGFRRGVEYYGSQLYQPGDSLKNIDWKHSMKHDELVTKQFAEVHGQAAVVWINLVAKAAEEVDRLTYRIIVTALSLAQEGIPAALAAYDNERVIMVSEALQPRQLVMNSLQIAREIVVSGEPSRYLKAPDIARLRANIERMRQVNNEASRKLGELMQLEYRNISASAADHPATLALKQAFTKASRQSNIVLVSYLNHDSEAVAYNTFTYSAKGNKIITV